MSKLKDGTPKIRFTHENGMLFPNWKYRKLGKLTTIMQSGLSRLLNDEDIGLPVIRSTNLIDGRLDLTDIKYWYVDDKQGANTELYILDDGDLLVNFINSIAQIGKVALFNNALKRPVIFTTNIMRLRFNEEVDVNYIYYFFATENYQKYIQSITKPAVNQASFTKKDFNKLRVPVPSIKEQRKIVEFLGSVDAKLNALRRKRALLAEYKRGVMQKLFTQQIRFTQDDGRPFPPWETKKLGELFKFKVGGDVGKLNFSKEKTDIYRYPVFANGEGEGIHGYADDFQYQPPAVTVTGRGNLGNARYRQEKFNAIVRLIVIEINKQFNGKFIEEAINNLNIFVESTGVPQLTAPQLSGYKLSFPIKKEQQKIADFLTAIDDKITAVDHQITHMETFKKALLQQMFV